MSEIMRRLKADHRSVTHLLDLFERELTLLEAGGERPNYELLHAVLEYLLTYPDLGHHPREDVVYRILKERRPQTAEGIGDLLQDHREIGALTRRFAEAVDRVLADLDVPRERIAELGRGFLERYRNHIRREDEDFFPAAEAYLRPEDWSAAEAEFEPTNDPLFGPEVEERFQRLRERIDALAEEDR